MSYAGRELWLHAALNQIGFGWGGALCAQFTAHADFWRCHYGIN